MDNNDFTKNILLILDDRNGFSILRMLGASGFKVFVITFSTGLERVTQKSRHSNKVYYIERNEANAKQITNIISEIIIKHKIGHVLSSGYAIYSVNLDILKRTMPTIKLSIPEKKSFVLLNNKWTFQQFIIDLGYLNPKTYLLNKANGNSFSNFLFDKPYMLKSTFSCSGNKTYLIKNKEQLDEFTSSFCEKEDYVLQEFIEGELIHTSAIICQGKLLGFAAYKVLVKESEFGVSIVRETISCDYAVKLTKDVVEKLNFNGFIGFDIILSKDGRYYPIECNPRTTPGLAYLESQNELMTHFIYGSLPNDFKAVIVSANLKAMDSLQLLPVITRAVFYNFNIKIIKSLIYIFLAKDVLFQKKDPLPYFEFIKQIIKHAFIWLVKMRCKPALSEYVKSQLEMSRLTNWLFIYTDQFKDISG